MANTECLPAECNHPDSCSSAVPLCMASCTFGLGASLEFKNGSYGKNFLRKLTGLR